MLTLTAPQNTLLSVSSYNASAQPASGGAQSFTSCANAANCTLAGLAANVLYNITVQARLRCVSSASVQ